MSIVMGMQNFIKIYQKVQEIGPVLLFSEFEPRQNLSLSQISFDNLIGYILLISVCLQNFITIFFHSSRDRAISLFQNLALGKVSTDDKCHFAVVSLFSEFESRQKLNQSQISFDNLMGYILSISMCMQNFITIFHSVQEIGPLSLFQNLELGKASADDKCHFAIPWARSCQYQCLRNRLSNYSTQFKR